MVGTGRMFNQTLLPGVVWSIFIHIRPMVLCVCEPVRIKYPAEQNSAFCTDKAPALRAWWDEKQVETPPHILQTWLV